MTFHVRARQSMGGYSKNTTQITGKPKVRVRAGVSQGRKSGS